MCGGGGGRCRKHVADYRSRYAAGRPCSPPAAGEKLPTTEPLRRTGHKTRAKHPPKHPQKAIPAIFKTSYKHRTVGFKMGRHADGNIISVTLGNRYTATPWALGPAVGTLKHYHTAQFRQHMQVVYPLIRPLKLSTSPDMLPNTLFTDLRATNKQSLKIHIKCKIKILLFLQHALPSHELHMCMVITYWFIMSL